MPLLLFQCPACVYMDVLVWINSKFWHCNICAFEEFSCFFSLPFHYSLQNLLVEAVSYKRAFAERHMTSIEFDAKVYTFIC